MGGSRRFYEEPHFRFEDLGDRVEMYVCETRSRRSRIPSVTSMSHS